MMRLGGLVLCLATLAGAVTIIGPHIFFDMPSLAVVVGGAIGYAFVKGDKSPFIHQLGEGAVFFGWIGFLMGLIAIGGSRELDVWNQPEVIGPAFAVSLLSLFYGYVIKLICLARSD